MRYLFCLLFVCLVCLANASNRDGDTEKELRREISNLKKRILNSKGESDDEVGKMYAQLGMLYQAHDIRVHDGGTMQPLALDAFQKALKMLTNDDLIRYQVLQRMGMLLKMMGRGEDAIIAHDQAYDIAQGEDNMADCLVQKAHALVMMGRVPEAIILFKKSLKLYTPALSIYLSLVKAHREVKDLDERGWRSLIGEMRGSLKKNTAGKTKKPFEKAVVDVGCEIYWALADAYDAVKEYELGWQFLELAHQVALQTRERVSDIETMRDQLKQVTQVFTPSFFQGNEDIGSNSKLPVFIVGMMRSGSTLTETMLDAHPLIYGMGEDSYFNSGLAQFRDDLVEAMGSGGRGDAMAVVKDYAATVVLKMKQVSANDTVRNKTLQVKRVVDKMLFNYRNIGFIHLVFPKAPILHTVRDPMDTLFSCYRHKFDDVGLDWSLDAERLVEQYVTYLNIMAHFRKVLPNRFIDVSYEKLVSHSEKTMKSVINFIGIPWNQSIMNFHSTNRTVHTHSMSQVRHGVSKNAVGVWTNYAKGLKKIIDILKPQLKKMKSRNELPFLDSMNWDLDENFDYGVNKTVKISSKNQTKSSAGETKGKRSKKGKKRNIKKQTRKQQKNSAEVLNNGESVQINTEKNMRSTKKLNEKVPDKNNLRMLKKVHKRIMEKYSRKSGYLPVGQIKPNLPISSNVDLGDDLMAVGFGYIIKKDFLDAVNVFETALKVIGQSPGKKQAGFYLGLSQAMIYLNRIEECVIYLDKLIRLRPDYAEAYVIKSQALGIEGRHDEAIDVLTRALVTVRDDKILLQRGMNYFKMKKYAKARDDFKAIPVSKENEAELLALVGKCEKEFGETDTAVKLLQKSLRLNPKQPDANLDLAIVLMEVGRVTEALEYVNKSLALDPSIKNTWGYAGLLYQTLGESRQALFYLKKALDLDPLESTAHLLSAMCYEAELNFGQAIKHLTTLINKREQEQDHIWFHREIAYHRVIYMDTSFADFSYDVIIDPHLKTGLNAKNQRSNLPVGYNAESVAKAAMAKLKETEKNINGQLKMTAKAQLALQETFHLKRWVQLDSPGFLPHARHHRMFGLSVLDMAQKLRKHVKLIRDGQEGLWVSDSSSSSKSAAATHSESAKKNPGFHLFSYRDFFDIAVRWRQYAEPHDIVFWLDIYPESTPMELVSLSTSLISGVKKNARYYPYFNFTFEVAKSRMMHEYYTDVNPTRTTVKQKSLIEKAKTLEDLFIITGISSIFFTITDVKSTVNPGSNIQGTRISITRMHPEGYDLSIGSPTNAQRFQQFSAEVKFAFDQVVQALVSGADSDDVTNAALNMFFYWANWGPLSRGSAATGYASLIAIFLAANETVTSRIPHMKQMDWESILRTDPSEFRETVKSWVSTRVPSIISSEWLDSQPGFELSEIFRTPRDIMTTLVAPTTENLY